jgi:hypothetical protein
MSILSTLATSELTSLPWDTIKSRAAELCPQPAVVLAKINVAARKCNAIQADGQVDLKPLLLFLVNQRHEPHKQTKNAGIAPPELLTESTSPRKLIDLLDFLHRENERSVEMLMAALKEEGDAEALV